MESVLAKQRAKIANNIIQPSQRSGRILDVGCGPQPFFLSNTMFSEKYGLDQAVTKAQENDSVEGIHLRNWKLETDYRLPFTDQYFDVVTMLAVIEHIAPSFLPRLIGEVYRVLKPAGSYIITTPSAWTDGLLRLLAKVHLVSATEIEDHKDTYTAMKLVSLLGTAGFERNNVHYGYFELGMNIWVRAEK